MVLQVYHSTVGQNAVMELDFAIDLDGLVDPTHAQRYKEFGDWIRACYDTPIARTSGNSTAVMLLRIPSSSPAIDRVWVREDQVSFTKAIPVSGLIPTGALSLHCLPADLWPTHSSLHSGCAPRQFHAVVAVLEWHVGWKQAYHHCVCTRAGCSVSLDDLCCHRAPSCG